MIAMITYSRLGAKVWRQVSHFEPVLARELRQEETERLDQEILDWYDSVPDEVKVRNWDKERHMASTPSYNLQRLRIWTYLRFNQVGAHFVRDLSDLANHHADSHLAVYSLPTQRNKYHESPKPSTNSGRPGQRHNPISHTPQQHHDIVPTDAGLLSSVPDICHICRLSSVGARTCSIQRRLPRGVLPFTRSC